MSGHSPKPTKQGMTADAYLRAINAWNSVPSGHVVGENPVVPGGGDDTVRINPLTGAVEVYVPGVGWVSAEPGGEDSGGTTTGGYAGQPLSEQLALLEAKYGWDSKLELEVMAAEYEKRGLLEKELIGINFENQKWLTDRGYAHDVKMEDLSQKHKLEYLRIEIGLTHQNKIELLEKQHGWDVIEAKEGRDFTLLRDANAQAFQSEQSDLDRELQTALASMDIAAREALQAAQIAAEQAMQQAGFSHTEKMQAASQAFDEVMQSRGFAHDFAIQEKDLAMKLLVSNNEIKSQEKVAANRNKHEKELQATQIAFDKEQKEEDRKLKRFEEVQKLRGKDPVRAALMAMGAGDALDTFSGTFGGMESMIGEDGTDIGAALQADTEQALQGIKGLGAAGQTISLGDTGVEGLQSVEKAGRSFVQGTSGTKTLIGSAQGIGGSTQAGVSEEDVAARVAAITPKGFEQRAAAGGIGPYLTPMVRQQYAAEGRGNRLMDTIRTKAIDTFAGGQKNLVSNIMTQRFGGTTPKAVGTDRPAVEPNTSYTVGEGQTGDGTRPEVVTTGANNELLSIEPATNDLGRRDNTGGTRGDPLVDMFNDPELTINRGGHPDPTKTDPTKTLPPVGGGVVAAPPPPTPQQKQVDDFKVKMDTQFRDEMQREGINEGEMKQIQAIRDSGQPLSPEQEKALNRYERIVKGYQEANQNYQTQILGNAQLTPVGGSVPINPTTGQPVPKPQLDPSGNPLSPRDEAYAKAWNEHTINLSPMTGPYDIADGGGIMSPEVRAQLAARNQPNLTGITQGPESLGGQAIRDQQIQMQTQRQQYIASLPPAQQAALRQSGQRRIAQQQNQLTNSLTPQTIEKLMQLINNPSREVNSNLQEVLPQLRDGTGNVAPQPQRLATVV